MLPSFHDYPEFEAFLREFTSYERLVSFAHDETTFALDRMRALARSLGNPHLAVPCYHVAGTKGKGSTCLILEALLAASGLRVGTYTSPHVEEMRERIRIEGRAISRESLLAEAAALLPALEGRGRPGGPDFPTYFEFLTLLAMTAFRRAGVDRAIHEVGLGGRLDATNIVEPLVAAVTSIGLEHTQQLGNRPSLIAAEKAGIIKPGVPVVIGRLPEEADREVRRIALERGAPVLEVALERVQRAGPDTIRIAGVDGALPSGAIRGPALRANLALALRLAETAGDAPSADAVRSAIARLELPARVELFSLSPPAVLDGAHTADSLAALHSTLGEIGFPTPRTLVFSVAQGKDLPGMLPQLPAIATEFIWTRADAARSVAPDDLRAAVGRGRVVEDPRAAFEEAEALGLPIVITGSFYLAGRIRPLLRSREEREGGS